MPDQLGIDGTDSPADRRMSLRAFAESIGVSHTSVVRAVADGKLVRSVGRTAEGKPFIADPELAAKEWTGTVEGAPPLAPTAPPAAGDPTLPKTFSEARKQKEIERVRALRLANDERAGILAPVADLERRYVTRVVAARTRLLGIPSRAKQRLPHLTTEDLAELDKLIREALDELAGESESKEAITA